MNEYNEDFFEKEIDEGENTILEYDITTSPRDLTPASIVEMIDNEIIEIPLFQRNYVWDMKKASKLVESLILGLPVPELFFYIEGDDVGTYKIIDGQQRFLSIYFFLKGRFPKNMPTRFVIRDKINEGCSLNEILGDKSMFRDFSLQLNDGTNSTSKYDGKSFNELDKDMQIKFKLRRFLRTVVVRQNKPDEDNSSMFEIFNRLNTGGAPLNPQEIRASLYYCDFYNMLDKLNYEECWRKIMSKPTHDLHSKDIETILRAMALLEDYDTYSPKMVTFLNKFSLKSKKFDEDHINYSHDLFISFIDSCSELGEKAFFRNNRFSRTLFESVYVTVCEDSFKKSELVNFKIDKDSFEQLKNDNEFISYLKNNSSSSENIKKRVNRAKKLLRFV